MISALAMVSPAHGHLIAKSKDDSLRSVAATQKANLKHAEYVCKRGAGEHKRWSCWAASSVVRKNGQGWLRREHRESQTVIQPPGTQPFPLPACTRELIDREGGWRAVVWNRAGSGAYGAPQALPGYKMASAGPDWATNIWTQIKWMIGYVNARYGGMCNALAFQIRNGFY